VLLVLLSTFLFQITAYKFIWGLELLSRVVNILILTGLTFYLSHIFLCSKIGATQLFYYVIPVLLVVLGMGTNLVMSVWANPKVVNQVGLLLPWLMCLSMPWLVKFGKINVPVLWRYFFYFILIGVLSGLVEYFLIFRGLVGVRLIETSGGPFMAGRFSMLYELGTGELHYRFYAGFMEPGTLAMFILPTMVYAIIHRKYMALAVLSVGMYLTDSLGGFVGVAMIFPLLVLFAPSSKNVLVKVVHLTLAFFLTLLFLFLFSGYFLEQYRQKIGSAEVREENIQGTFRNAPEIIASYPFGLLRKESTLEMEGNILYSGNNFTPGNALIEGGFLSFIGYSFILILSLWVALSSLVKGKLSDSEKIICISIVVLFPFIFQRQTIWDSSLFALLFAPHILKHISSRWSRAIPRYPPKIGGPI